MQVSKNCLGVSKAHIAESTLVSGRRKVLDPFEFSGGVRAHTGDWVCVPQMAMMHDAQYYPNSEKFDAFRSANAPKKALFTDTGDSWMIWGTGNTAW